MVMRRIKSCQRGLGYFFLITLIFFASTLYKSTQLVKSQNLVIKWFGKNIVPVFLRSDLEFVTRYREQMLGYNRTSNIETAVRNDAVRILGYGYWGWSSGDGPHMPWYKNRLVPDCPIQCYLHFDIEDWRSSDIILYFGTTSLPPKEFCDPRVAGSKLKVLQLLEAPTRPPPNSYAWWSAFNGCFHHLATYRQQEPGGFSTPYGGIKKLPTPVRYTYVPRSKTLLAVWPVSNCKAENRRGSYVTLLQHHMHVDIVGKCGPLKCPNPENCLQHFENMYFFYFAFENTLCTDYATEKIWRSLQYDIVPVVLGGANYTALLPPNSFINVLDFATPKDLADYLRKVSLDLDLYRTFLAWKTHYKAHFSNSLNPCELCQYYNKIGRNASGVPLLDDVNVRWNGATDCFPPPHYFRHVEIFFGQP